MPATLIVQSHRQPLPCAWIDTCLASVREWARANGYDYRFLGDELFTHVPREIRDKTRKQPVIATDLARLHVMREALEQGAQRVVWLDADFLIFAPQDFVLPSTSHAVGREVWIQEDKHGAPRAYKKVHNALLMACRENAFLDFYLEAATRLLWQNRGPMPPQFIGPKLLTALHNVVQLPVMESAGILSPWVIRDLNAEGGPALELFLRRSSRPIAGANLCLSSQQGGAVSESEMVSVIERLVQRPNGVHTKTELT
ncbi:MAG: hypothetical protein HUJ29_04465 [Gammaproteobacteria bacterium]|nr:hypothetical protein [Gammaproteobacteria bacterium]